MAYFFSFFFFPVHSLYTFFVNSSAQEGVERKKSKWTVSQAVGNLRFSAEITASVIANRLERTGHSKVKSNWT